MFFQKKGKKNCAQDNFFFLKILYIYSWETQGERQRQAEKQAPCREPTIGLHPGSPGSCPGPKAALNHWATQAALKTTFGYLRFHMNIRMHFSISVKHDTGKIHPFRMSSSVVVSIVTELCNYHHYLILEHFHHPKKEAHTHYNHSPVSPPPVLGHHQSASVSGSACSGHII